MEIRNQLQKKTKIETNSLINYIKELRGLFCENDEIIISVDTKNKELIGNF